MTIDTKRLGYGGSAVIAGQQVLITSGSFGTQKTPSYIEAYSIPPSTSSRARMKHADGIEAYTADVSLDVTDAFLTVLTTTTLLGRRYLFDVGIHDGESAQLMTDCFVSSLSLSGASGGIVTAQISAVSKNAPAPSIAVANAFIRDDVPLGYWYSGNTQVRDWTFTFNQGVTPVYGNENVVAPRYIKAGLIDYNLQVTTYVSLVAHTVINIATRTFTLTGVTSAEGYQFNGVTDLGMYSHSFETAASATIGSGGTIIT